MKIFYGAVIAIIFLFIGLQLNYKEQGSISYKDGDIVFVDENPDDLTKSKIIMIVFKEETANSVLFELTYNFHNVSDNLKLSVWPNMKDWSFTVGKIEPGLQTVTLRSNLSSSKSSVHISDNLTFALSSGESKYNNWDDIESIPFEKIWFKCGENQSCNAVFQELTKSQKRNIFKTFISDKMN